MGALTKPERIPRHVRGKRDRWFYVDHEALVVCREHREQIGSLVVVNVRIPLGQLKRAIAAVERSRRRRARQQDKGSR
jgi:hypothetical protein